MHKTIAALPLITLMALPFVASAHEHQTFEINGMQYEFTIGSMSEPVIVDDKTGVSLKVVRAGVVAGHEEHHEHTETGSNAGVTGLEETLKVELIAGDARKTIDFAPAWNAPGSYTALYFPTEAVPLSYRVFGTLEDIPFDVTFACAPQHDMEGEADATRVEISPGVTRVEKRGNFGCPQEKAALGFPEEAATVGDAGESGSRAFGLALGSGVLSLVALGFALRRRS